MSIPGKPHDGLFRALLDDPRRAAALIRDHLPAELAARLGDGPPRLVDGSYIDRELRGSQSDRLFQVALRDGRPAFLFVLLEHKSTPDPGTPLQILGYMTRIWQRHAGRDAERLRGLPPIIPLVFYHGSQPWTVPTTLLDCIDMDPGMRPWVEGFRYILRDLGPIDYAKLSADSAVRAALGALKHAFSQDLDPALLARLIADLPDGESLEIQVLRYIIMVHNPSTDIMDAALAQAKPERKDTLMPTVVEYWTQKAREEAAAAAWAEGVAQGKAEGVAQGKAEGVAKGKAELLLRQIRRRFGAVGPAEEARVRCADEATLDRWSDEILDTASLEALLGPGSSH